MNIQDLKNCLDQINQNDIDKLKELVDSKTNIIILGNGGSNAIASHISQDYTKALGKKSVSFSDSSRLTCYINDYGMDEAYVKFLEHFCENDFLVILISSSGNSPNIINAAEYCKTNKIDFVTLSGFDLDNKLNRFSDLSKLNFWVDSFDYGIVECLHQIILHSVI
jgi:D-sedoheptulose 7-phosphate isomerase